MCNPDPSALKKTHAVNLNQSTDLQLDDEELQRWPTPPEVKMEKRSMHTHHFHDHICI